MRVALHDIEESSKELTFDEPTGGLNPLLEHGSRQRGIKAAECAAHAREIGERTTPFDRRQPRDRSPAIRNHDLAALLDVVDQIGELLPRFPDTGGSHGLIVSQVAHQFQWSVR